jgi:YgiT-type zinc finger domain-containing protein
MAKLTFRVHAIERSETQPGFVTVTLEREGMTLVFKGVPAQVCANCGESYVDETTTAQLLDDAESAVKAGVQVEVRTFKAA